MSIIVILVIVLIILVLLGAFGVQQGTISLDRLLLILIFLGVLYLIFGGGSLRLRG